MLVKIEKKSGWFLGILTLLSPILHAIDLAYYEMKTCLIKNETPQEHNVFFSCNDGYSKRVAVKPGRFVTIESTIDSILYSIKIDSEYYHVAFAGYDTFLGAYALRITNRLEPEFPTTISFDGEIKKDANFVSFMEGHSARYAYRVQTGITTKSFYSFLKNLYDRNPLPQDYCFTIRSAKSLIPRIMHHIWFGGVLPERYAIWRQQWLEKHPSWQFILWDETSVKKEFPEGLVNQQVYDQAQSKKNYGKMADVAKYEILYRYGGLALDLDVRCLQAVDFLHEKYDFYAALEPFDFGADCSTAVIGCKSEHPILKECIDCIKKDLIAGRLMRHYEYDYAFQQESAHTLHTTGNVLFTQAVLAQAGKDDRRDIILPASFLCHYHEVPSALTCCIHEHELSWAVALSNEWYKNYHAGEEHVS